MDSDAFNLRGKKILIIDDNNHDIHVLKGTLEPEGYKLSFANSGKVALEIVEHNEPDLIMLDIMMPEMDGFTTYTNLQRKEGTRDIPIIFVTGKTNAEDIVKGFELGGVDYVTKPFRCEEVCARVKTHLRLVTAQKLLKEKNELLIEKDGLKNNFLGLAAHDLRNPLTVICSLAQLMQLSDCSESPGKVEKYGKQIHTSGTKMLTLINELLDVAAIESGNLKLNIQPASLSETIQERLHIFEINAQKKRIKIHTSFNGAHNTSFDKNYISQVVDNLISNAIKFSEFDKNIYITIYRNNKQTIVSVKDEGPGISKEDQKKLFGKFQKLSAKPTNGEVSTGLGLAITKRVIEAHDGVINVDSKLGSGTTFSFSLPIG